MSLEVGAYFYPHAPEDAGLNERRQEVAKALKVATIESVVELDLARNATPLFAGHNPRREYVLGRRERETWSDSEPGTLYVQAAYALEHGLSYWIVDSYEGVRQGRTVRELHQPLDMLRASTQQSGIWPNFKYAKMETLESPRAVLPIPNPPDLRRGFGGGFDEPNRQYDLGPETAQFIVDMSVKDWEGDFYLRAGSNEDPYLSILMPKFPAGTTEHEQLSTLERFMGSLRSYAQDKYRISPYLVGVVRHPNDTEMWTKVGVEAITQYAKLPDHSPEAPSVQRYEDLIGPAVQHWDDQRVIAARGGIPFVPTPAIGWDATYRAQQGVKFEDMEGLHPYSPVVIGGSPELFAEMFEEAIDFTLNNVPEGQRHLTIFAWNEYTEGAALMPVRNHNCRKGEDMRLDKPYLDAIKRTLLNRTLGPEWYRLWLREGG